MFNHKAIQNMGWLLFDKVFRMGMGLLVGVWIAKYLQPAQFGELNYLLAFTSLFMALANVGIDGLVVREIVKQEQQESYLIGSSFVLRLGMGMLALVLCVLTSYFTHSNDNFQLLLISILSVTLLFQSFDVIDLFFQAKVKSKVNVIAKNIAFFVVSLFKIYLIVYQFPIISFVMATSIESAFGAALLLYFYKKLGYNFLDWKWDKYLVIKYLKEGIPLLFSSIVVIIYMKIDQIMLKEILNETAVGIYSVAVKISEIFYFIPVALASTFFPFIINAKAKGEIEYNSILKKMYFILGWSAIAVSVSVGFFSYFIINFLYGEEYLEAVPILIVHVWSCFFVFMGVGTSQYLVAEGLTKISFYRTFAGAILNIILNLFFIPYFGAIGAAYATLLSYFVATFSIVFFKSANYQCMLIFAGMFRPNLRDFLAPKR